jgi:holo-[acyl-carrier protein] synthase
MIFGVGTDIIKVERMESLLARGSSYLETIFTQHEMDYCENKSRKAEHYAARFAAKEAFMKALGTGWRDGLGFSEIEVLNDEQGKPQIQLYGKARERIRMNQVRRISISLSHINEIAIAVVIMEK